MRERCRHHVLLHAGFAGVLPDENDVSRVISGRFEHRNFVCFRLMTAAAGTSAFVNVTVSELEVGGRGCGKHGGK